MTAALAACNKSGPAATTTAPADAPAASASAAPAPEAVATDAPAADDTAPVSLDMGKVKAWVQAQKNLAALEKADPALDSAQNISEENTTQYVARLEANAKIRAAIESAGLSVRDYARIGDTLIGAMMAQGAVEAGQLKKIPDGIDPAAVDFVKQHKAEIGALMGPGAG
ncbi:MAG TPA: hypothetical protein VLM17_10220 [Xanthomonadaceae bacterium]|nr:hypothetical protein [Xanthomonadaceae bacterium]